MRTCRRCRFRRGLVLAAACGLAAVAFGQTAGLRPPVPGSTTVVVLPDTQYYSQKYPTYFEAQTRWIAANATNRHIAYVMHVGDITQSGSTQEWAVARRSLDLLGGKVPYLLTLGTHDYLGARSNLMSTFFPVAEMQKWPTFGGVLDAGTLDNSYHLFRIGNQDWIALALEFGPSKRTIAWANEVLTRYPSRRAIVVTHAYLFKNSERYDHRKGRQPATSHGCEGDGADGQELWDGLIRGHSNVMIVICGHVGSDGLGYRVDRGDGGNAVHQMMCCYQRMSGGGQAYLRLLEFMPDGQTVRVQTYSPVTKGINPWNPALEDFMFTLQPATREASKPAEPLPGDQPASARTNDQVQARLASDKDSKGWRSWPTRTLDSVPGADTIGRVPSDRYGAWLRDRAKATGFFRTGRDAQGRWWLIDPEGRPFLTVGVNAIRPNPTTKGRLAMEARFGSEAAWATNTAALLRGAGFNTLGCWSRPQPFMATSNAFAYTTQLHWMATYGGKRKGIRQESGHVGFTDDCIFVFDPGFEAYCREAAKELVPARQDPWLIGYFSDNELPFPEDALQRFLRLPKAEAGRSAAEQWLSRRRGAGASPTGEVSRAESEAFLGYMAGTYFRIVSSAIRTVDPNHLYLGCRFYGPDLRKEALFRACAPYVDVVSINWYRRWTPIPERMDDWMRWTGKPFLISEWCAMASDSGMANETGAGWIVPTQADRGRFYQNFALGLLANRGCVGWHWYRYLDNDPADTVLDPVNVSGNKGIVNIAFEPFSPLVDAMRDLNVRVYPLRERLVADTPMKGKR